MNKRTVISTKVKENGWEGLFKMNNWKDGHSSDDS